ncbi:hypothetical protein [Streptomyces marianii]|uniref:Uncharacterized protein n=1 Tax=Streptomyces marianii TaxID=1817406 RepID=A0A5R9E6Z3_9ACTN|nr:hypothetical protein [Streptomyces marianii]TLQ45778.1 hypothetical protein FEF34_24770 [Streptomyces marianii]
MITALCSVCHRALDDDTDLTACDACAAGLRAMLTELPRQLPLLAQLLRPGGGPAQRGGTGRAHSPLPVRLDVLDLLGPGQVVPLEDPHGDQSDGIPIAPLVYGWARYIAQQHPSVSRDRHGTIQIRPCDGPASHRGNGIAAWCAWLTAYVPYVCTQPWVAAMHEQLEQLLSQIRSKTGSRPGRTDRDAPCPECACFALVSIHGDPTVRCEACGTALTAAEYAEHAATVLPPLTALAVRIALQQAESAGTAA